VWDRLSSGAGAALSAVQDAYGTARDARVRGPGAGGSLGELQDWTAPSPRRASPSVFSSSPTLSTFDPPRITEAVRASTFSSASRGTVVNPWATSPPLPSSPSSTAPREGGGIPSVLVDNPWNTTARTQARPSARRPPLEDAFAVGGMEAALPPLPPPDPLGIATSTSHDHDHHSLPADPYVALPTTIRTRSTSSRGLSASASSASSGAAAPPPPPDASLDAFLGSPSSATDGSAAPKVELGDSSEKMDPLGVGIW